MPEPETVVLVRFTSSLPFDDLAKIVNERAPRFRELTGTAAEILPAGPGDG